ncbi:MAG: permease [Chthoniobacterales bacterium]
MDSIFNFNLADFSFAFLSILLEGLPFLLLGTALSGLIDQFLPARLMSRLIPNNLLAGTLICSLMGIIFPMCECGVVPVIRRLMKKGLPASNAITYMLAAPVVNPVVAVSTYTAFKGQMPLEMALFRLGIAVLVAVVIGIITSRIALNRIVREDVMATFALSSSDSGGAASVPMRLWNAVAICAGDFLGMMVYFVAGSCVAAIFNTAINQDILWPLAVNDWLATFSMMGLASVLSVCSTTDAFIAATFTMFPAVAKLAFLTFGPIVDLKLIFIYSAVFRKRFIFGLVVTAFVLIVAVCMRLRLVF